MTKTVGVIGVGHLMAHVVPGLMRAKTPPEILLSARNADRSAKLAAAFGLEVVEDNTEIVRRSEIVIMAVRPFDIEKTIAGLPWRDNQTVLSVAGSISQSLYEPHINGASIVLAMPVIAAEFGLSPTSIFPDHPRIAELLAPCGPVLAFGTEAEFKVASGAGTYFVWVQALIEQTTNWMVEKGLPADKARQLVSHMTLAGGHSIAERVDQPMDLLIEDFCLPGSLSGQGLDILRKADAFGPWREAAESIYRRHKGEN